MTDTTAPRTAAGDDDPIFTLAEIRAFAAEVTAREAARMAKTRTAAGRALVAASRTIQQDGAVITVSDGDVLDAILAIERESESTAFPDLDGWDAGFKAGWKAGRAEGIVR